MSDVEDIVRRAKADAAARIASEQMAQRQVAGADTVLTQGAYQGLAQGLGMPVDLMNQVVNSVSQQPELFPNSPFYGPGLRIENPIGGSESLKSLIRNFKLPSGAPATYRSIGDVPEEYRPLARGAEAAGATLPFVFTPYAAELGPVSQFARNAPKAFLRGELAATSGAGVGAAWAEDANPGDPTTSALFQMAGGFVHPSSIIIHNAGGTIDAIKNQIGAYFTRSGREALASSYLLKALDKAGEDPEQIAAALKRSSLPGVNLSSGQKTGSRTLLAIEANLARNNPMLGEKIRQMATDSLSGLRNLIDQMAATGDPRLLATAAKLRQSYFESIMQERFSQAQRQLTSKLANLSGTPREASREATQIIENSLSDARAAERELWAKVPTDVKAGTTNTQLAYQDLRGTMLPEEMVDPLVSSVMRRLADQGEVPAQDLFRLRSRMLTGAREARARGEWDKARQYAAVADGAYQDLAGVQGADEARQYSKALNDAFTRTFASDALATNDTGARRISPDMVLDRAFGRGGTQGDIRMGQLEGAAQFAGKTTEDQQANFLRAAASNAIGPDGRLNTNKLQAFLADNQDILKRFPKVAADLADANTAEQTLRNVESSNAAARNAITKKAAFAQFIGVEDPARAISKSLAGPTPEKSYGQMAALAAKGGRAQLDGLKAATLDYATNQALSGGNFSFTGFKKALTDPVTPRGPNLLFMMQRQGVMSRAEAQRLQSILDQADQIETALRTRGGVDVTQTPDGLYDLVVRIGGANIGGALGRGSGAPIVAAGAGSRMARNLFEKIPISKTQDVLEEAATNPEFASLLLAKRLTPARQKALQTYLNAFMIQAGIRSQDQSQ